MADFDEDEEKNINEDISNLNELGLIRDSQNASSNRVNNSDYSNKKNNLTFLNNTLNMHNKIAENLAEDSQEEIDENNDAEPEELIRHDEDDMNKTVDDIWAMQIYGKRDPNEKIVPFESKKAKFFERILHPIQYGSLRGSIFGLSSMCLEASAMILALRCQQFGLINYLIFILLGGFLAYSCLVMMIKAGKNIKEKNYSKVVKTILGKKVGVYVDINIALYLFGALISFMVIIYQLIGAVVYDIMRLAGNESAKKYESFIDFKDQYWRETKYLKFPIMFGVTLLVLPLCLLKDISKMRIPSLIGVLALVYSIIVVVVESFFYLFNEHWDERNEMNWYNPKRAFSYSEGIPFFGGLSTVFYLYSCHAGAFPVYKSLRNNTTRRIKKVFQRSILLDICIYFCIAAASFLTEPFDKIDIILYRDNLKNFQKDYFILIAKIGIIFNLFFSTPANYAALRLSVFELIWGNPNITKIKNIIVTVVLLSVITLIGALYDEILEYIELLGGFCSVVFCILIPGLIYAKNDYIKKTKLKKYGIIVLVAFITAFGYTSGILTILFNIADINGTKDKQENK
jgi:amino acid permease